MSFGEGEWTLSRTEADFSPLEFSQRYTGRFSDDGRKIRGRWESSSDGRVWTRYFELTYTQVFSGACLSRTGHRRRSTWSLVGAGG